MMVTPAGGVKAKSASLVGMFSVMAVKVKVVVEPSICSTRMAWIWPVGSTVREMARTVCCMPTGAPERV